MKVAVSATGGSLDATVDPRFGRCPYYVVVDTETMAFEAVPNTSMSAPSGAGIGAAQIVAGRGVEVVLTGAVGPNAMQVLSQAGIKIVTGAQGSVGQAVEAFKSGRLKSEPTVGYGLGGFYGGRGGRGMGMGREMGMGRGMGMGLGRGMGMGGGRGMYTYPSQPPMPAQPPRPTAREQEKVALTRQLEQLDRQLQEVKKRLEELRG